MQTHHATFRLAIFQWIILLVVSLAGVAAAAAQSASDPVKRVLVVYENDSTLAAAVEVAQGLRTSMQAEMPATIEIYSDYLDVVRFPQADHVQRLVADLTAKYADIKFDVVMAVGPGALKFLTENKAIAGADTPVVFGAVTDSSVRRNPLPATAKGVISHFDVRKTMDLAMTLQPDAKNIVVMTGSSAFDKSWQDTARQELADSYAGLRVSYVSDLTIEGFVEAARQLPRQTILLVLTIFEDSAGRTFVPRDAAALIAPQSGAPVYGVYSTFLGTGAVGGYVGTFHAIGEQMGKLGAQVIKGDFSAPQSSLVVDGPLVDWHRILH
ncbi:MULTISPECIES: hypothetical protein [unclassified Rhizobium]|uniref:ABC transporter substrate-binding protein n=1 Tax=unclassified Rhizobium TaxID=2613769 RepID=UPI0006FECCED|nr:MULTISPECIES: hypothetical protein [unclassified Rhizobium]KQV35164.1 hypothetical protein ASC86_13225 [Rhizobium sp. Root1212]KRD24969.1 hypothetical protein ASE37_13220 [Rhizobium sp. Root268]